MVSEIERYGELTVMDMNNASTYKKIDILHQSACIVMNMLKEYEEKSFNSNQLEQIKSAKRKLCDTASEKCSQLFSNLSRNFTNMGIENLFSSES